MNVAMAISAIGSVASDPRRTVAADPRDVSVNSTDSFRALSFCRSFTTQGDRRASDAKWTSWLRGSRCRELFFPGAEPSPEKSSCTGASTKRSYENVIGRYQSWCRSQPWRQSVTASMTGRRRR